MLLKLLVLFVTVPFIELALLLYIAKFTGGLWALVLVIVTGVVGSLLARSQGWRTYANIQSELAAGRLPAESMLDAVMIFIAGALLLTPGVLTDVFGLSLLVPPCRRFYRARIVQWFKSRFTIHTAGREGWQSPQPRSEVIDSYVIDRAPDEDRGSEQP